METLLDITKKFVVFGPDEKLWYFVYELIPDSSILSWQAYSAKPGFTIYIPDGPWSEDSVNRFIAKHSRKLTDSDRIDLFLFLHKGGIERFLKKELHDRPNKKHSSNSDSRRKSATLS